MNHFKPTTMQDKITADIAAYLERETLITGEIGKQRIEFGGVLNQGHFTRAGFCQEIAREITAAIMPLVPGVEKLDWSPAPEWAQYTATFDSERYFFEDIFYPCRFVCSGRKTVWKGDFKTQVKNASWDGIIERRPK